jgi:hypothetical protein
MAKKVTYAWPGSPVRHSIPYSQYQAQKKPAPKPAPKPIVAPAAPAKAAQGNPWAHAAIGYHMAQQNPALWPYAAAAYQKAQQVAPQAPKAVTSTAQPMPFDAGYESQVANINRDLQNTLGQTTYEEQQAKQEYGIDDPSNPYSRAALLQRSYEQGQTGATNQYAASGQLYSGALQNARTENTFQLGAQQDALQRGYQDLLNQLAQRRTAAQQSAGESTSLALNERIARALEARTEDPGPPPMAAPAARAPALAAASGVPKKLTPSSLARRIIRQVGGREKLTKRQLQRVRKLQARGRR